MQTNFQMLQSFEYSPARPGFCSEEEVTKIMEHFKIQERSNIELRNLRDFVVLYFALEKKDAGDDNYSVQKLQDTMSAITGVIDQEKFNRGMDI